ncbi:triacylglycerol lipase [Cordyceps militaris]|uniref:Triacylglycerol lipase n=1 Tax=Cordyceps militaris TaxID=73501 RepID=A0A2H4SQY5_CORMI|nr:triacylglycerol lipase [Cordyceps militaris]
MSRRAILQRPLPLLSPRPTHGSRTFCASARVHNDPRIPGVGREIVDDFAQLREHYATPKYPIVLAHGLFGFSELRLVPQLPALHYWHGIQDALQASGATVFTTSVPPSSSIAVRAAMLAEGIAAAQRGSGGGGACSPVNIIAHSMGGLDARYMISHLLAQSPLRVASLTTVATPHRGSPVADFLLDPASPVQLPRLYRLLARAGLGTEAFAQLTTRYMTGTFNPATPDAHGVRYFSYGADMAPTPPSLLSVFRLPYRVVRDAEGPNDGLVSVASSRWGDYRGTLVGVSHLDLINWTNRVRWALRALVGRKRTFNAVAFYLDMADMLAREGL